MILYKNQLEAIFTILWLEDQGIRISLEHYYDGTRDYYHARFNWLTPWISINDKKTEGLSQDHETTFDYQMDKDVNNMADAWVKVAEEGTKIYNEFKDQLKYDRNTKILEQ